MRVEVECRECGAMVVDPRKINVQDDVMTMVSVKCPHCGGFTWWKHDPTGIE